MIAQECPCVPRIAFFISDDGLRVPLCIPRIAFFIRYFAAGYKDFMAEGWCEIPLIAIDWN
jgi:hypothetical protein